MDSSLDTAKDLGRSGEVRVEVSRGLACSYRETGWGHHEEAGGLLLDTWPKGLAGDETVMAVAGLLVRYRLPICDQACHGVAYSC